MIISGSEEYKMQKMNQSVDNLSRTYGNGVSNPSSTTARKSLKSSRPCHRIRILMLSFTLLFINLGHIKFKPTILHRRIHGFNSLSLLLSTYVRCSVLTCPTPAARLFNFVIVVHFYSKCYFLLNQYFFFCFFFRLVCLFCLIVHHFFLFIKIQSTNYIRFFQTCIFIEFIFQLHVLLCGHFFVSEKRAKNDQRFEQRNSSNLFNRSSRICKRN